MKKNFKKVAVAGALVGVLTVSGVSSVAMANGNSYQNYKNALMKTAKEDNLTLSSDIKIKQNGTEILSSKMQSQVDDKNNYTNNEMLVNNKTIKMETSIDNNKMISNINGKYSSMTFEEGIRNDAHKFDESSSSAKFANMVADTLVGNVKNNFTGNKDNISVNLEGAQIPELLNLAASAIVEQKVADKSQKPVDSEDAEMQKAFKKISIVKDVKIKKITLNAKLENELLKDNKITVIIGGKDANGKDQEVEVNFNASISDIGSTKAKSIDTTGKTVEEKTQKNFHE